jgi:hypothetical protein
MPATNTYAATASDTASATGSAATVTALTGRLALLHYHNRNVNVLSAANG